MLFIQQDILTFDYYKQLKELIRIIQRINQMSKWKNHVRSLHIYCRFNKLSTVRIFQIFCDDIDLRILNSASLKTLKKRNKKVKEKTSLKEI